MHSQRLSHSRRMPIRIALWSSVVFLLIASVLVIIKLTFTSQLSLLSKTDQNSVTNATEADIANKRRDFDWTLGNGSAKITLIEYGDFQCAVCRRYYRMIKKLSQKKGDDFRFIFRHYPLDKHKNASLAARSAEAAGSQGKFWEMHDQLFEKQREWARKEPASAEQIFTQYADALGLDVEKFLSDLHSHAIKDRIATDYQRARGEDVFYTPTFFVNGKKIAKNPRTYDAFLDLIFHSQPNPP